MDFYDRAKKYLKGEFPERSSTLSDKQFKETIENDVEVARLYGFESEANAMRFIDLQWRMGENFDAGSKYPWVREILNDAHIAPAQKIAMIRDGYAMHVAQLETEAP